MLLLPSLHAIRSLLCSRIEVALLATEIAPTEMYVSAVLSPRCRIAFCSRVGVALPNNGIRLYGDTHSCYPLSVAQDRYVLSHRSCAS